MDEQSGELVDHYKALTDELEEKNRILMATMNEKDKQVKRIHEQYEEMLRSIKEKEGQIVDLEFQLLSMADGKKPEHDSDPNEYYQKRLKEKDDEIEQLNNQLFKRTCDLQGLVNNELWQKNREIERLQQRQASRIIESKDLEIEKLNVDLMVKEKQLGLIVEKISELGLDIEIGDGEINIEGNLQAQLEKSEKLRAETNDVCTVLSRRLEELAFFLDSLLKQKSVLGFLGNKENRRLRQIIDQSLDLSRSFTMSMLINPDQSLLQLTSISSVLDNSKITEEEEEEASASRFSIMPDNISLTYKSHLHRRDNGDHSQIIQTLRQQIVNLKYELQLRDVELGKVGGNGMIATDVYSDKGENETQNVNLHTTSTTLKYKSDNQSESEAWSEPDRTVSRARIGLQDGSIRSNSSRKSVSHLSTDSTEDEDIERSPRSTGKKGVDSRNTILELHRQVCDLTQKMNEKEVLHKEANNKLKQELANLQLKLEEAEQRSEQLQQEKENLLMKFEIQDKELNNKINSIEVEKTESLKLAEDTKQEMQIIERKLISLQNEMALSEQTLRSQYEEQLHDVEEDCLKKIKSLQNNAEMEIKLLHDTIQQLHLEYTTNYVKKRQVEEAVEEIERLKSDLESLEDRMKEMNSEGVQSKKKLNEYEDKINSLRSDLDNTTLQYSEAVLEKTKIANEKALIEQELNRTTLREIDMKKKLQEMEVGLEQLLHTHQKKMSLLQEEKSLLEVRVSELESSNAQLHNKLIKYQTSCGDQMSSTSLPNTPNFVNQIVSFRRQHSDNSNYLPDDQFVFEGIQPGRGFHRLMPNLNLDLERNEANSSPDLGIESDHGRFSSLETHLNVQRPLLQTLELTESMSNLLDTEGPCIQELAREDSHCCQKSMEMANENTDLKRKLLRTRRALEETVSQLTLANQRKKQVEKTICKQIHKTSQVLRKAKANLDSGSETDGYRK